MIVSLATYTFIHTALSLIALAVGFIVIADLFAARIRPFWTGVFLFTAIATSVTGFGFPFNGVLPSHIVGVIALIILAAVLYARYIAHFSGTWRRIYAAGVVASVYLLAFVAIAQAFLKVPALKNTALTQAELPFVLSQGIALAVFVVLGVLAAREFRRGAVQPVRA
ncbi:hypothetical protein [Microvirga flavescens]|uniref:hypothetical protein n=1 Tax=Microvirga flavescens TaxID=2249811 RepID=UPI000DDA81F4|nr:hypothetical protein [Microvirga flavescens]